VNRRHEIQKAVEEGIIRARNESVPLTAIVAAITLRQLFEGNVSCQAVSTSAVDANVSKHLLQTSPLSSLMPTELVVELNAAATYVRLAFHILVRGRIPPGLHFRREKWHARASTLGASH
jgi:hypothetical protein